MAELPLKVHPVNVDDAFDNNAYIITAPPRSIALLSSNVHDVKDVCAVNTITAPPSVAAFEMKRHDVNVA